MFCVTLFCLKWHYELARYEFVSSAALPGWENWCHIYVGSIRGVLQVVSPKRCSRVYFASIFYDSRCGWFWILIFYLCVKVDGCNWEANLMCSVMNIITFTLSVPEKLGCTKMHAFCFQLISAVGKAREKRFNCRANCLLCLGKSFNRIWSDACQYLQVITVLFGSGKHWKIWLFIRFVQCSSITFFCHIITKHLCMSVCTQGRVRTLLSCLIDSEPGRNLTVVGSFGLVTLLCECSLVFS